MIRGIQHRTRFLTLAAFACLALSYPAAASTLNYSFSFSGSGLTSSGSLTVSQTAGIYLVTAMTGLFDGSSITGPLSVGSFDGNDNQVFPAGPYLDFSGISFAVGATDYNVFYDNGHNGCEVAGYYVDISGSTNCGPSYDKSVSFKMSPVPEPSGVPFALLTAGLALGFALVRRNQ